MLYKGVAAYLAQLPDGIRSYGDMVARASVFNKFFFDSPFRRDYSRLPPEVAALVAKPPEPKAWVPEVYLTSVILGRVEQLAVSEKDFLAWCYQENRRMFMQPLNRLLVLAATPEMLLRGAASRFAEFHKGIGVSALPRGQREWELLMTHRPGLVPELVLRAYATAFTAAMEVSRLKEVRCELVECNPSHGRWRLTWSG
jgi:hypothetical protein